MVTSLPDQPSLEHLRKQAKDLIKAHDGGDPSCCEVLRMLRRFAQADEAAILSAPCGLQEAQFALALSYGFRNWDHLKAYVESLTPTPTDQRVDIEVRPIRQDDLDRVVLRCWPPDRDALLRLFDEQGTIGMAAWAGGKCVGVVHNYRRDDLRAPSRLAPRWAWGPRADGLPPAAREAMLSLPVPIWSFSCYHVGRTLASDREEHLGLIRRFAVRNDWDAERTTAALNKLDAVALDVRHVQTIIDQLRHSGQKQFASIEPRYHSRGIGTALCKAAVQWARDNGYAAVIGPGAPAGLFEFAVWAGSLPQTTYAKLGFRALGSLEPEDKLPVWAQGNSPPEVMRQVEEALRAGRTTASIHSRLMAKVF